ncbi:TPA: hypothetical protein ACH3X2_006445 [Trebouxia sp. C0005]
MQKLLQLDGFPAGPQSNRWGPEASISSAASELHDDGMRPPGFSAAAIEACASRQRSLTDGSSPMGSRSICSAVYSSARMCVLRVEECELEK